MTIDSNLQIHLDQPDSDDLIDIIVILDASAIHAKSGPVDPSNLRAGRKMFAETACNLLNSAIEDASEKSGQEHAKLTIFDNVASARLLAPAELIRHLGQHPSVASIRLALEY